MMSRHNNAEAKDLVFKLDSKHLAQEKRNNYTRVRHNENKK